MSGKKALFIGIGFFVIGLLLCMVSVFRYGTGIQGNRNDAQQVKQGLIDSQGSVRDAVNGITTAQNSTSDAQRRSVKISDGVDSISKQSTSGLAAVNDGLSVLSEIAGQSAYDGH